MKIIVEKDEWWPVYTADEITESSSVGERKRQAELSDAEWADLQRLNREFDAWQDKLRSLYRD